MINENHYTFPIAQPRDYMLPAWQAYSSGCKNIIISAPRRSGKSLTSASMAVQYALQNPNSSIVILAPTRVWAEKIFFNKGQELSTLDPITGFKRELAGDFFDILLPKKFRVKTNMAELSIYLHNGSKIQVQGSDSLAFVGQRINCLCITEAAQHKSEIFPLLSPVLTESGGVSIIESTVTNEDNHFWNLIENAKEIPEHYHVTYLTAEDTKQYYWVSDDGTFNINPELEGKNHPESGRPYENIQVKRRAGESLPFLMREYLNICTNIEEGSYYETSVRIARGEGRIDNSYKYDINSPVHTFWDLGVRDMTVILFAQFIGNEIRVIDCYANNRQSIDHYIDIVRSKPYVGNYASHHAPHDSKRTSLQSANLIDLALRKYDFKFSYIPKSKSVIEDIQVIRSYFERVTFNKTTCSELLKCLNRYSENPNTGKPYHGTDGTSDFADAFRYLILSLHKNLIPKHDMFGNNNRFSKVHNNSKLLKNVEENRSNMVDSTGNFAVSVEDSEDWFSGETFIKDLYED